MQPVGRQPREGSGQQLGQGGGRHERRDEHRAVPGGARPEEQGDEGDLVADHGDAPAGRDDGDVALG